METYQNQSRESGVFGFEMGADFIRVQFKGGDVYLYDYNSTGPLTVEEMKALALKGKGLHSFIRRFVSKSCAYREK